MNACPHTDEDAAILARTDPKWRAWAADVGEYHYMTAVMQCPADDISTHHLHIATLGMRGPEWHALMADIVRGEA